MKKEHKLQRNLDSTFEAELKLCSLSGLTTWCSEWSVWGLGMGLGADCQVHICLGVALVGVRDWVVVSASGLQQVAQWCSLRLALFGVIWEGTLGPLVLGLSIPPPSLQALHRRAPKRISQNPAFTLPASELLLVLFSYLRLLCPRLRI